MLRLGLIAIVLFAACGDDTPAPPPAPPPEPAPIDLSGGPVRFEVAQRTDVDVPGSAGRVRIHLGDITDDQVRVRLSDTQAGTLAGTVTLADGGRLPFELDGHRYRLVVVEVDDRFLPGDRASFELQSDETPTPPTEKERIEMLLQAVEKSGLVFVRNGSEHDSKKAASHLADKWKRAADQVTTAEQFIEQIASRSSTTGRTYEMKLEDGSVVPAADWLQERLAEQP